MLVSILDGYIDEPSRLGVPPFISPYPRYVAGAVLDAGHEFEYLTVDHWRQGQRPKGELTMIIQGALVPGKYLRTMPMSGKELGAITGAIKGGSIVWSPTDSGDPDALAYDLLTTGERTKRRRAGDEWARWAVSGSTLVKEHQDFPQPLIAEIDMSYGCAHYITGGCSFCTEPQLGEPVFREVDDIIAEVKALLKAGCTNFRLGGQSCIFSFQAEGTGETATPKPNVPALKRLFGGLSKLDGIRVLHTDNANPAIIAAHPEESLKILENMVTTCTSGNSLSLGVESTDPEVIEANNLNSTPEQVMKAIKLINKAGAVKGPTGLPSLLPGLNFLGGLEGETKDTFRKNNEFLDDIVKTDLILRRINIRQVASVRRKFAPSKNKRTFHQFKRHVREEVDPIMLNRVAPMGTVLKDVYTEVRIGKLMFARQIGTYPLLVGIPQDLKTGRFLDVKVTDHGSRSLTAIQYPLNVNDCQMSGLEALPGIGRKRAARIVRARPFRSGNELAKALDEPLLVDTISEYLKFE